MSEATHNIVDVGNVKPYRSPKQRRQVLIAVVVVLLVAGLGGGAYLLVAPKKQTYTLRSYETAKVQLGSLVQTTQSSGTVALPVQMNLASPEEGYAAELYVAEGDIVKKGQVLARIRVPDLEDDLEDEETSLAESKRSYEQTVAENRITALRSQRAIDLLDADIRSAEKERDRLKRLVAIHSSPQSDLDTAQKSLDDLLASQQEKVLQLAEDRELYALEEQSARGAIADLETKIARLKKRIAEATISSPMDGEVLEIADEMAVPGSLIEDGTTVVTVADPASAIVELEVLEQYSALLKVGQSVKLTVGSATLTGRITSIGKVAEQSSDGLGATVVVKVKPEGDTSKLILGNTAVGEMELGTKDGVMSLPRGPYLTTGSQRYLYKVVGGTARRVVVTFGTTEGNTVEVLSGVQAGDEIVTTGYQNFIEYEEIVLQKGAK